jgi:hypothetical protein
LHALRASAPALQAKKPAAAGGGKKGGDAAPAAAEERFDLTKVIPVNLSKEGPQPEYAPDAAYPPWLWRLLDEVPTVEDVLTAGVDGLTPREKRALAKRLRRRDIKAGNSVRGKA